MITFQNYLRLKKGKRKYLYIFFLLHFTRPYSIITRNTKNTKNNDLILIGVMIITSCMVVVRLLSVNYFMFKVDFKKTLYCSIKKKPIFIQINKSKAVWNTNSVFSKIFSTEN